MDERINFTRKDSMKLNKKSILEKTVLLLVYVILVSLMDYYVVMLLALDRMPASLIYQIFLSMTGFWAALIYLLVTKNPRKALSLIPVFAVGKFLTEHVFFIWVDLLGDPRNFYTWYTHNPLNPDGKWGYNWTVLGMEGNVLTLALSIIAYYVPGYFICRWLVNRYYSRNKKLL
jgi:hypothetical protein